MIKQIFDEQDLPLDELKKIGLATTDGHHLDADDLQALLTGRRTSMLRLENLHSEGFGIASIDAKVSMKQNSGGTMELMLHPIYREAQVPDFITEKEAESLEKGDAANLEKTIFIETGDFADVLVEFDRETREFIISESGRILAPDEVNSEQLTTEQKEQYRKGKEVKMSDGTTFQYSGTEAKGMRSNKLALIASLIVDGGVSYIFYKGLNALFGQKAAGNDRDEYSRKYYDALQRLRDQEMKQRENSRNEPKGQQDKGNSRSEAAR